MSKTSETYYGAGDFLRDVDNLLLDQDNERLANAVRNLAAAPEIVVCPACTYEDETVQIGGWMLVNRETLQITHSPAQYRGDDASDLVRQLDPGAVLVTCHAEEASGPWRDQDCECKTDRWSHHYGKAHVCWSCDSNPAVELNDRIDLCDLCYDRIVPKQEN